VRSRDKGAGFIVRTTGVFQCEKYFVQNPLPVTRSAFLYTMEEMENILLKG
jgi:hypothetical protein